MGKFYDVIVIGSGATGIWVTRCVARAGLRVLMLEAFGPSTKKVNRFASKREFPYLHPRSRPFNWQRIWGMGGRTPYWARTCLRMSDLDFSAGERDGHGPSWPLSYRDLEKHYDEIETALGVVGQRDRLPQVPDGKFKRVLTSEPLRYFQDIAENRWPGATAIAMRRATTSPLSLLSEGLESGHVEIQIHSRACGFEMTRDGTRIKSVKVKNVLTREVAHYSANQVVLCGSTISSAALLLGTQSRHHPTGLSNSSGLLGRHLMDHTTVHALGVFKDRFDLRSTKSDGRDFYIPRFQNLKGRDRDYSRGFGIQCFLTPCESVEGKGRCLFEKHSPPKHDGHANFVSFGEVLSDSENRIYLDGCRNDDLGLPIVHIDFQYGENDRRLATDQIAAIKTLAKDAGVKLIQGPSFERPGTSVHELGTARMGRSPSDSVLNSYGRSWDVENLYVPDGACFPTTGAQNPTLTMMAISGRAAQHIIDKF